ncbi:MAG: DUF6116 family protein [Candidatus Thiodiazotropha taylori]
MHSVPIIAAILKFADRLRFRQLFLLTGTLFLLDLVIPDVIPFADELILGLLTLLFAAWRKPKQQQNVIEDKSAN